LVWVKHYACAACLLAYGAESSLLLIPVSTPLEWPFSALLLGAQGHANNNMAVKSKQHCSNMQWQALHCIIPFHCIAMCCSGLHQIAMQVMQCIVLLATAAPDNWLIVA